MEIYPEIKKIAGLIKKIENLVNRVELKVLDIDDLDFFAAQLIDGCSEKNGKLYRNGGKIAGDGAGEYYCDQHTGYCEDYFYGTLYFKTNVPGQFVAVPFST